MQTQKNTSSFQFGESIDGSFMENMYDNDFQYIEEIFSLTLSNYDADAAAVEENYKADNAEGLRKAIHKIKAAFGFIGMLELQNDCQSLESRCASVISVSEIKEETEILLQKMNNHKIILQNEYLRLKSFNLPIS